MVKFSAGYLPHREAHLIGLGLSDGNLAMLRLSKPIQVRGEDLRLPGCNFGIFWARDEDGIKDFLGDLLEPHVAEGTTVPIVRIEGAYYFTPITGPDDRVFYVIGLTDAACDLLRAGAHPTFRNRFTEGEGTSVEILLFWGQSEEAMEAMLYASGLIGPETKVTKT